MFETTTRTSGRPPPIEAILLDLDGTLLDIDFAGFMREYVTMLASRFEDHMPPAAFQRQLFASTRAMIFNDHPERTVLDAFLADFAQSAPLPGDAIARFEQFYETDFPRLERWGQPMPGGRSLVEAALNRDLPVVIATAPLFPETAIRERLRWAGIADVPYHFITTSETMTRSKPLPDYYHEIAERIGIPPKHCLMIGDETVMDGTASQTGMPVALVGPEKPSFTEPWIADTPYAAVAEAEAGNDLPRFPDLPTLHGVLREEGVL